jgi:hypothetical protein
MSGILTTTLATVHHVIQNPPTSGGGGSNVPNPHPDPSGVPGQSAIETILNVVSWIGLVGAVVAVLVGGGTLAFANATANGSWGSRGKLMVISGLAGALVVGLGPQLVKWTFDLA